MLSIVDRHYAKWNRSEKDKYRRYHFLCRVKKYSTLVNITKEKQTRRYREQTVGNQWEREGGEVL